MSNKPHVPSFVFGFTATVLVGLASWKALDTTKNLNRGHFSGRTVAEVTASGPGDSSGDQKLELYKEYIGPNEEADFDHAADVVKQIQESHRDKKTGDLSRGFHSKAHGCLRGVMNVLQTKDADVTDDQFNDARQGIFAPTASETYPVWVRYSNGVGRTMPDVLPDVRGMALKVLNVPGDKILDAEKDAKTQDFLMTNNPTPLGDTANEFVEFGQSLHSQVSMIEFLSKKEHADIKKVFESRVLGRRILSMLTEQFWSGSPYRWGKKAAKFTVQPCQPAPQKSNRLLGGYDFDTNSCAPVESHLKLSDAAPNFLHENIVKAAKNCDICYNFYVQMQTDPEKTPIEHALTEWTDELSKPIRVAQVTFPAQTFWDQEKDSDARNSCEKLSFTPWHSIPEHQPLGNMNRARKKAYEMSRSMRNAQQPNDESNAYKVSSDSKFLKSTPEVWQAIQGNQ